MKKNALDERVHYLYSIRNKLAKFLYKIKNYQLLNKHNKFTSNKSPSFQTQTHDNKPLQISIQNSSKKKVNIIKNEDNVPPPPLKKESYVSPQQTRRFNLGMIRIQENEDQHQHIQEQRREAESNVKKTLRQSDNKNLKQKPFIKPDQKNQSILISTARANEIQQYANQKKPVSRSPLQVKTSRKLQSFTPRKQQSDKKSKISPLKTNEKIGNDTVRGQGWTRSKKKQSPEKLKQKQIQSSSMMQNLSNLIFTIKMTKQEYNQFMKIKKEEESTQYRRV